MAHGAMRRLVAIAVVLFGVAGVSDQQPDAAAGAATAFTAVRPGHLLALFPMDDALAASASGALQLGSSGLTAPVAAAPERTVTRFVWCAAASSPLSLSRVVCLVSCAAPAAPPMHRARR